MNAALQSESVDAKDSMTTLCVGRGDCSGLFIVWSHSLNAHEWLGHVSCVSGVHPSVWCLKGPQFAHSDSAPKHWASGRFASKIFLQKGT